MLAAVVLLQSVTPLAVQRTGVFESPRITESSGVVVSRTHAGVLWTTNDSGDGPYLYATTLTGADRGAVRVAGAAAVDWEDLALGPCPVPTATCVYIADTGDNRRRRTEVAVYAVPEPTPPTGAGDTARVSAPAAVLRVRYPDGAHDVEALFVTTTGSVYLVTKGGEGGAVVFRVPRGAWGGPGIATAELVQHLPRAALGGGWVTGADVSPSGQRVAVRTYGGISVFSLNEAGELAVRGRPCDIHGHEPQGEALAFLDERHFVLTSEAGAATSGPLHVVSCPLGDP